MRVDQAIFAAFMAFLIRAHCANLKHPTANENENKIRMNVQKRYSCNFENGICLFLMNDLNNRENWKIGKGEMNALDTGPSIDHTLGNANGSYLFVNCSAAKTNEVKLQTVVLNDGYCVRFFYHMFGADIGDLTVLTKSVYNPYDVTNFFYRNNTQGDRWKEAVFYVTMTKSLSYRGYRVIFSVKHRKLSSTLGDIALDDIDLTPGICPDTKEEAETLCSYDYYNCGYVQSQKKTLKWEWNAESQSSLYVKSKPSVDHTLGTSKGGYWFVSTESTNGLEETILTSPKYKAPALPLNCLHFYYYMEADKNSFWSFIRDDIKQVYLQAYITDEENKRKLLVKREKNNTTYSQWIYVETKINITGQYQFEFTAGLETSAAANIALDDVRLSTGNCPDAGFCDFEDGMCTWIVGDGDFNWVRKSGKTNTNWVTGPYADNTLKNRDGHYVVINAKGNNTPGAVANLQSEWFPPSNDTMCLSFYCYFRGDNVGSLASVINEVNSTETTIWLLKKDPVEGWHKAKVPLRPSVMYNQVIFRGIIGNAKKGFMALDDVRIRKGEKCDFAPSEANPKHEASTTEPPVIDTKVPTPTTEPPVLDTKMPPPTTQPPVINTKNIDQTTESPVITTKMPNPCTSNPCLNGGSCLVEGTVFKCVCKFLYTGEYCENDYRYVIILALLFAVFVSMCLCRRCCTFKMIHNQHLNMIFQDPKEYKMTPKDIIQLFK